ncbi:hypothetical protein J6590_024979 [Homalodisca vitripennis]|nr:hypothetical protein J6590_024979 [Homalodisca vitripennis]
MKDFEKAIPLCGEPSSVYRCYTEMAKSSVQVTWNRHSFIPYYCRPHVLLNKIGPNLEMTIGHDIHSYSHDDRLAESGDLHLLTDGSYCELTVLTAWGTIGSQYEPVVCLATVCAEEKITDLPVAMATTIIKPPDRARRAARIINMAAVALGKLSCDTARRAC